jgi:hypothetical protein
MGACGRISCKRQARRRQRHVFDVPVIQAMADSYQLDADIDVPGTWGS